MMHPSIEGLREAATRAFDEAIEAGLKGWQRVDAVFDAQAAYFAEHGVGWFGEGLVRAERVTRDAHPYDYYYLVPVPQDDET